MLLLFNFFFNDFFFAWLIDKIKKERNVNTENEETCSAITQVFIGKKSQIWWNNKNMSTLLSLTIEKMQSYERKKKLHLISFLFYSCFLILF